MRKPELNSQPKTYRDKESMRVAIALHMAISPRIRVCKPPVQQPCLLLSVSL
jgi:hypothetical protein